MRELKFRIWDYKNKKYFFVNLANLRLEPFNANKSLDGNVLPSLKCNLEIYGKAQPILEEFNWSRHFDYKWEQFTGLKDKNGEEIYEGDILKWKLDSMWKNDGIYFVNFDSGCFGMTHKSYTMGYSKIPIENLLELSVIGNIHENPELLQE